MKKILVVDEQKFNEMLKKVKEGIRNNGSDLAILNLIVEYFKGQQLTIPSDEEFQTLMNDISEWSDATFGSGQRNPAIAYHLKKEIDELITELTEYNSGGLNLQKTKMEFADCFMLLFDSAHHFGITAKEIIELSRKKLEINKQRKWGKPDADGVVEHLKGGK